MYATGNHVLIPRDADQDDDAAQQAMINICRELPEGAERRIGGGSAYPLLTAFWALAVALRDIAWLARSSSAQS